MSRRLEPTHPLNGITRVAAILAVVFAVAACRALAPGMGGSGEPIASVAPASGGPLASVAPASVPVTVDEEAPAACGFPPGTPLEFAGRSTTAELDVQEVVGDPMSDDPADIYITRDKLDQGSLHGRLVCAIYVDHAGFVEITVHPADGGRYEEPPPTPTPTPLPAA